MKVIYLVVCLFFTGIISLFAQEKLEISGKIRVLKPTTISLENIEGKILLSTEVGDDGAFALSSLEIEPDVYLLCFGQTKQPVYLTNTRVTIRGFYNYRDVKGSSLSFTGIDTYYRILKWVPEIGPEGKVFDPQVQGQLQGNMYSALAYFAEVGTYEQNKFLLDCMSGPALETMSGKWLQHRVDSLSRYLEGVEAFNFTFPDSSGRKVSLSDFRGKIVLVDFWASWCGPCREEMKSLLPIYNELKGTDLEFISVSLDSKEVDWRRMLKEEQLPWVMLWDEEGFHDEPNEIQRAYGFYSIPFIVLIDRDGRVICRDLCGEKVREAILKARKNLDE